MQWCPDPVIRKSWNAIVPSARHKLCKKYMCFVAVHVRCSRECLCVYMKEVARMSSMMTGTTTAKGFAELDCWSLYLNRLKVRFTSKPSTIFNSTIFISLVSINLLSSSFILWKKKPVWKSYAWLNFLLFVKYLRESLWW